MKRRLLAGAALVVAILVAVRFAGLAADPPAIVVASDTLSTRCDSVALNDLCAAGRLASHPLVIEHATVLPMDRDTALTDHSVVTHEGRIVWVGPSRDATLPANAMRIDASGAFVIPGLADMHVHVARETSRDTSRPESQRFATCEAARNTWRGARAWRAGR